MSDYSFKIKDKDEFMFSSQEWVLDDYNAVFDLGPLLFRDGFVHDECDCIKWKTYTSRLLRTMYYVMPEKKDEIEN